MILAYYTGRVAQAGDDAEVKTAVPLERFCAVEYNGGGQEEMRGGGGGGGEEGWGFGEGGGGGGGVQKSNLRSDVAPGL